MKFPQAIEEYVKWKNLRGIKFRNDSEHLRTFSKQVGDCSLNLISAEQTLSFLDGKRLSPATWWRQYNMLRAFFEFWMLRGELKRAPMPRPRLAWPQPFKPYIYSREELSRLLEATRTFQFGHWVRIDPVVLRTLILFIYGTGACMREVISLRVDRLDLRNRLVTLGDAGGGRVRTIPFGRNLRKHLLAYSKLRAASGMTTLIFFVDKQNKPMVESTLRGGFQRLRRHAGIRPRTSDGRQPGFRDLRHTFAVHRLAVMLKEGKNPRSLLPALSAYMGHVKWIWAERYLSLTPERFWDQLSRLGPVEGGPSGTDRGKAKVDAPYTAGEVRGSLHKEKDEVGQLPFGEIPPRIRW
ncbi:MAG: tyrosine-type recombinase/integrase [Candidatus Acidiferrum sp.]